MSDSLLFSISSIGSMTMDQYNTYFDTLYGQNAKTCDDMDLKDTRNKMMRVLDSLGYCEFDFDRRYVTVCDSAIISLPHSGIPKAIYTGARTKGMLKKISSFGKSYSDEISIRMVPQYLSASVRSNSKGILFRLPDTILIEAVSKQILSNLSDQVGIKIFLPYSPVSRLANFSVGIEEFKQSLSSEIPTLPDWPARIFDVKRLRFVKGKLEPSSRSIIAYTSPIDQQRLHVYSEGNRNFEVDRDWGRYLALKENKKRVLLYDERRQVLALPSTVPLPRLLSRAAAMCSGKAPVSAKLENSSRGDIPKDYWIDIYQAVPKPIALIIASKLGQELVAWNANEHFGE